VKTRQALPSPSSSSAVLSSATLQITALRSISVVTVNTAAGPTNVIQLQAGAATIGGLDLLAPCVGHVQVHTTAAREVATGGLTLNATALQVTVLGVTIILAAADLPVGSLTLPGVSLPPLPTDTAFLSVKMFVQSIRAPNLTLTSAAITSSAC